MWGQLRLRGQVPGLELKWQMALPMQTDVKRFILISDISISGNFWPCKYIVRPIVYYGWWKFGEKLTVISTTRCNSMLQRFAPRRFAGCFAWCIARQSFRWRCPAHGSLRTRHEGLCVNLFKLQKCSSWRKMAPQKGIKEHTLAYFGRMLVRAFLHSRHYK